MAGLGNVSVPAYMVRSTIDTLRVLGDAHGGYLSVRKDVQSAAMNARTLTESLDRLIGTQTFPHAEAIVARAGLASTHAEAWRAPARQAALLALFEQEIRPAFDRLDQGCKGQARFNLMLTAAEG